VECREFIHNKCCWLVACREEKIKRAIRQQKHASATSETASDRSRTDRDSAEVKPGSFTLPLAAAPERGILKKGSSLGSIGGITSSRPSHLLLVTTGDCVEALSTSDDVENRQRLLLPAATAAAAVSNAVNTDGFEFIDDVDERDSSCSCSCDEDEPVMAGGADDVADAARPLETAECSGDAGGCSVETQTDPESLTSSMASVYDPGDKMTRICNINELLRQIDEQFNSVLRSASMMLPEAPAELSPANSDDVRGSETEADRACPRFFSQKADESADVSETARDDGAVQLVRPVVRAVPLVPHELSPSSPIADTAATGLPSIQAPVLVSYRGATTSLPSTSSVDGLLSHQSAPVPPGASSSPATVTSEGYHSDRLLPAEPDLPVIIREIPKSTTASVPYLSDCSVRPPSKPLNSPDDVDV